MSAPTTHLAAHECGPAVVDGRVRWLSATLVASADESQLGGCLRRFHFQHVTGLEDPGTSNQGLGTVVHSVLEHFLRTGQWAPPIGEPLLGPKALRIAMAGRGLLQPYALQPGNDVEATLLTSEQIESIATGYYQGGAVLESHGIPFAGHSDLLRPSPWYVTPSGDVRDDLASAWEVLDHKTTKALAWAKSGAALLELVQMVTYAEYTARRRSAQHLRLSHQYYQTAGQPTSVKTTVCVPREDIARRWERIEGVVGSIRDSALVPIGRSNDVDGNRRACRAYNRDCIFASRCDINRNVTIHDLLGETMADSLLDIFDTPAAPPAKALASELDKLAAEEAAAKAATPATPAPPPRPSIPQDFADAVKALEASSWGFPSLSGAAAQLKAQLMGVGLQPGAGLAGSGKLAKVPPVSDPAIVVQLAKDVATREGQAAKPAPAPAAAVVQALVPPETPASDPKIAALPLPGTETQAAPVAVDPSKPKRRGRKTDAERAAIASQAAEAAADKNGFTLHVNAVPFGAFEYLDDYCDDLCAKLCSKEGAIDVRCGDERGPLGFGKWQGVVAALARAVPPEAGVYVVFTDSAIKKEIASALSPLARGGSRGVA